MNNYDDKSFVILSGILDKAVIFFRLVILMSNLALYKGSSKQGKAILANCGSNCVTAIHLHIKHSNKLHAFYI
jgi:hypothetical protein